MKDDENHVGVQYNLNMIRRHKIHKNACSNGYSSPTVVEICNFQVHLIYVHVYHSTSLRFKMNSSKYSNVYYFCLHRTTLTVEFELAFPVCKSSKAMKAATVISKNELYNHIFF
jgi:hypothetical protein